MELCNCQICSATASCSAGSDCYHSSSTSLSYCFEVCAGTNDESCPCDRVCRNVRDISGKSVSLCLPPSFSSFVNDCDTFGKGRYMCAANSSLYLQPTMVVNSNISVLVDNDGNSQKIDSLPFSCKLSSDCFDGNLCTVDEYVNSKCEYSLAGNCSSMLPHLREQYTPYSYLQYVEPNLFNEQQEFIDEIVENGQMFTFESKDSASLTTVTVDFWIAYFGNLINSFSVSGAGVVSLPPLDDCDNKQVSLNCLVCQWGCFLTIWCLSAI